MSGKHFYWTLPQTWPASAKVAAGAAAVIGTSAVLYVYLVKKRRGPSDISEIDGIDLYDKTPEEKALLLKTQGNKLFQSRNYAKAIKLFAQAIEILKEAENSESKTQSIAILYNNYSACLEFQNNVDECLVYTNRAIEFNPDYIKPYARRSRLYKLQKKYKEALIDMAKVYTAHVRTREKEKFLTELNELSIYVVNENIDSHFGHRVKAESFLPISQITVYEWMHSSVIHDPLLNMLSSIDENKPKNLLKLALFYLKNHSYDMVLSAAFDAFNDSSLTEVERMLALLLAARIYFFAGLLRQAKLAFYALDNLWEEASKEFKAANTNLIISIICLKVWLESPEIVEAEIKANLALFRFNADPFVTLYVSYHNTLNYQKAEEMLVLARQSEPGRLDLKYHQISLEFLVATQKRDLLALHNLTAEIDRHFRNEDFNPPEFAVLTAARIFHSLQNYRLSIDLMQRYTKQNRERSIIYEYFNVVLLHEADENLDDAAQRLGKDLEVLIEKDPYNFEINRMLFRCYLTSDFNKAAEAAVREWLNARTYEEFAAAYQDIIIGFALTGSHPIPMGDDFYCYKGPDYIHLDSNDQNTESSGR